MRSVGVRHQHAAARTPRRNQSETDVDCEDDDGMRLSSVVDYDSQVETDDEFEQEEALLDLEELVLQQMSEKI